MKDVPTSALWIIRSDWQPTAHVDSHGALVAYPQGQPLMDAAVADNAMVHLNTEGTMVDPVDLLDRPALRFESPGWGAPVLRASANPLILLRRDYVDALADVVDEVQIREAVVNDDPAWRLVVPPLLPTPPLCDDGSVEWDSAVKTAADLRCSVWSLDLVREPVVDDAVREAMNACGLGVYLDFVPQASLEWLLLNQPPYEDLRRDFSS